jgi:hypothetical protein
MAILLQAKGVACVRNSFVLETETFSGAIFDISESIVAGTAHVVIKTPNEAVRNVLPTMAGLKIFAPSPPKTILPIAMETMLPIIAVQIGSLGGSDNASIIPVTTALKSSSVLDFLQIKLQSHSVATHEITQVKIRTGA